MLFLALVLASFIASTLAVNFDFENIQLTEAETRNYSAIRFGDSEPDPPDADCKVLPGDKTWPSDADWSKFNQTLGGALLKPLPLGSVCYFNESNYNPARCDVLKRIWTDMTIHSNDPISVMSQWSSGSSCVPTSNPNSTCTQGGFPVYVVNATTVRHIQLAVNFARNQNLRLVIKNSGHNFNGVSIGGGSLSVWVHNLKDFQYFPNYNTTGYSGRAVAYAGGYQALDAYMPMAMYNMTMLVAGGPTVGIAGGFLQAGGHSTYTSYYGLAADHVLSIQVVTASGKFVTADATHNSDLFWALRGGGGGNWGIITSIIIKAFPSTSVATGSITFTTQPTSGTNQTISDDTFWAGMRAYWEWAVPMVDAGGLGYNFIRHRIVGNASYLAFDVTVSLPGKSMAEYRNLSRPLIDKLNALGFKVPIPAVKRYHSYQPESHPSHHLGHPQSAPRASSHLRPRAIGDIVGNTLIASRLFPRKNFETPAALDQLNAAIREVIDASKGNYTFHGMNYAPTLAVAGNPKNAVNPAFRTTLMHAQSYEGDAWWDTLSPQKSVAEQKRLHDRHQAYMQKWRDISPGGGSYMNEGDAQSPEWKAEFYGNNYQRLYGIKQKYDPWGVFWALSAVGSDDWDVTSSSGGGRKGVYTQDGRLCRA